MRNFAFAYACPEAVRQKKEQLFLENLLLGKALIQKY